MKGGYFHSVGHTEVEGLRPFLDKISPEIDWIRCFPARNVLTAPRPIRSDQRPPGRQAPAVAEGADVEGLTGPRLAERMLQVLRQHHRGPQCGFDFVLLVDDADCRFRCAPDPERALREWTAELTDKVREAADKPKLGFHALLAFPEVEAWLLADWERGFGGGLYRGIKDPLHRHIRGCVLHPLPWAQLEDFGGQLVNGSCEHKLSSRLQAAFHEPGGCRCTPALLEVVARQPGAPLRYSKKIDGADMLRRIRPDEVRQFSPRFRAALEGLRRELVRSPA